MSKYRAKLPQLHGQQFLADGGLETTLIFHNGIDLPCFAAFPLIRTEEGRKTLRDYFTRYIEIASAEGYGFILDTPTWRASADWGEKLGYSAAQLDAANRASAVFLDELRAEYETAASPMVLSGALGPRGDGYDPGLIMTAEEAESYHTAQIVSLSKGGVDLISAFTMTNVPEAIGITRAALGAGVPVVISFTVETDGRLPTGETPGHAIETVDRETGNGPAYYMINCAHPTHFSEVLSEGGAWLKRLKGMRANASKRSHAELDSAPDLDAGDPVELSGEYRNLIRRHGQITVMGGCCGTDHRHIGAIASACRHH